VPAVGGDLLPSTGSLPRSQKEAHPPEPQQASLPASGRAVETALNRTQAKQVIGSEFVPWGVLVLAGAALLVFSFFVPWWRISQTDPYRTDLLGRPMLRGAKSLADDREAKEWHRVKEQVELVLTTNADWYIDHFGQTKLNSAERILEKTGRSSVMLWGWNTGAGIMGMIFGVLIVPVILVPMFVVILRRWSWTGDILSIVFGIIMLIMALVWVFGAPSESVEGRLWQGIIAGPWLILVGSLLVLVGCTSRIISGVMIMLGRNPNWLGAATSDASVPSSGTRGLQSGSGGIIAVGDSGKPVKRAPIAAQVLQTIKSPQCSLLMLAVIFSGLIGGLGDFFRPVYWVNPLLCIATVGIGLVLLSVSLAFGGNGLGLGSACLFCSSAVFGTWWALAEYKGNHDRGFLAGNLTAIADFQRAKLPRYVRIIEERDKPGTLVLVFSGPEASRIPQSRRRHVEIFIDGKINELPSRIINANQQELMLTPGEHNVSLKYNGIEVYSGLVNVNKPSDGKTFLEMNLVLSGTVLIKRVRPIGRGSDAAYVRIDGIGSAATRWPVGADHMEVTAEIGARVVEVYTTRPSKQVIASFTVQVEPGKQTVVNLKN
jgi:hypothetical protein